MKLICVRVRLLRSSSCKCVCPLAAVPFVTPPLKLLRQQSHSQARIYSASVRPIVNYLSTAHSLTSNHLPHTNFCGFSNTRPLALTMATTSQTCVSDSKEHVCPDDHKKPDAQEYTCNEQQVSLSDNKSVDPAATSQLSKRAQKKVCSNTKN